MTTARNRAVRLAAKVRLGFAMIEEALDEAKHLSIAESNGAVTDLIADAVAAVQAAHAAAALIAAPAAAHFNEDVGLLSGGDGKV